IDARVSLGIVHGSRVALERPGECNPKTVAPALGYVETALERIVDNVLRLDAMRAERKRSSADPATPAKVKN
ncbi:MAG: hypothetical protein JOY77_06005, partial [Alphaproteobacteria bacterium]|nr:hypothetical protein [Alphaproteobacteria bacterium]